jgi:hypothetical protein
VKLNQNEVISFSFLCPRSLHPKLLNEFRRNFVVNVYTKIMFYGFLCGGLYVRVKALRIFDCSRHGAIRIIVKILILVSTSSF